MRKKHAYLAIALLLLIFVGCRKGDVVQSKPEQEKLKKPETQSVIGGTPTSINFKPYQVAIFINGDFSGGGIIINSEWILTAAHVVTVPNSSSPAVAFPLNQITVKSGSTYLNSGGTTSTVNDVIIHGGFPFNDGFTPQPDDIALVRLSTPLSFNSNQAAINYAISEDPLTVGDLVSVSGWGMTSCTATTASNSLNAVDIEVDDLTNPANIGCKPPTGVLQTAWKGDSGGPLVKNITGFGEVAVGVVNSVACGLGVGNYARVSHYAGWIYGHTGISRFSIQGTSSFCGSATYSISNLPAGATVNWSNAYSGIATLTTSGNTATLNTNAGGTLDLNATVTVGSQVFNLTKNVIARKTLDINNASIYATIVESGYNRYFNNPSSSPSGDASIVVTEIVDPYTYGGVVSIADPSVTNMNITVSGKSPSNAIVSVSPYGGGQLIKLKGITTSATFKVVFSNSCGVSVTQYVYVRAPSGMPIVPIE